MSFKTKKQNTEEYGSGETAAAEQQPYMVFNSKEDYDAAIGKELEKKGTNEQQPINQVQPKQAAQGSERDRLIGEWQRDAAMLKLIVPEFDFDLALKDESFRNSLVSGKSVFESYKTAAKPQSSQRNEILQNAKTYNRTAGEASINPAKLNSKDFKEYIESRRNS